jgi:hypothetical protein
MQIIRTELKERKTMKRSLTIKILALTALLIGSLAVAATELPFSANGRGVAAFVFDGAGNVIGADVTGSGHATHLGTFTNSGRILFAPPDPNNPTIIPTSGDGVLTAADGDKLYIVVEDGVTDVTTGIGTGKFRFKGGTGRFVNATGLTSYVVEQSFLNGSYEVTIVGNIAY